MGNWLQPIESLGLNLFSGARGTGKGTRKDVFLKEQSEEVVENKGRASENRPKTNLEQS
jgi:hypothetical protein